ncbi:SMC family ATPase [Ruminococcus sp. CLA-AA-H200]|uniref:Nuclease SbcCD subunit C n=1 Tax=Ruminococcus turbiniformis TaxID=2881258 RepID=A0ABS8G0V6_9FIRM|nr:SMC family ATPase [Ruminococcus turbiniformis]MCC2255067.1 SMC family ATPase [Ruminococcus turbiniformis]
MRPLRLTMQAFGSYGQKTEINFEKTNQNLFLITGDTGAGKTTIFDAIVFALYGEASSGTNRKDGTELQSQYVESGVEPFVELVFSEGNDSVAERAVYMVRRVPRHFRPLKRGKGLKEESGSVSLILPDGTEYPPKETDRKLEEIAGLTKSQFRQVAMIAQGEFMEVLRAKSDDKKVIFRKLFHTEIYGKIVEELARRRKEKQQEIAQIRTVCQTEVSHAAVPETWERAEEITDLKRRITGSDRLSVVEMEHFLDELSALCDSLKKQYDSASEVYAKANAQYLAKRDECTEGMQLIARFEELEQARRELDECLQAEPDMNAAAELAVQIDDAYQIQAVYRRYMDSVRAAEETKQRLSELEKSYPNLVEKHRERREEAQEKDEICRLETAQFTKVDERVENALGVLRRIKKMRNEEADSVRRCKEAEQASAEAGKALQQCEKNEREWRQKTEELSGTEAAYERWQAKCAKADETAADITAAKEAENAAAEQREAAEKTGQAFARASSIYEEKHAEYESVRRIFLNTQAGFIAREQLKPGQPCPVCGSLEHPHPCELDEEHREITRESLDKLGEEVNRLRAEQEKAASASQSAQALLQEKERNREEKVQKLWQRFKDSGDISAMQKDREISAAEERLLLWRQSLDREGRRLAEEIKIRKELQKNLLGIEGKKAELKTLSEQAEQSLVEEMTKLAGIRASLSELEDSREYEDEEQAAAARQSALEKKTRAEKEYRRAQEKEQEAKSAKENAETLMERYRAEIPVQEKESADRKYVYENQMEEKDLSEQEWKALTGKYEQAETAALRERIDSYRQKKAAAAGRIELAQKVINSRRRPSADELTAARDGAKERMEKAQEHQEKIREYLRSDEAVYHALRPVMEERGKVMAEHKRIDDLYSLLSGNVTGSRMDIETFVQRYYLEQILRAANRRFSEMSAGQFELRMCDISQAGKGKNRGLDLMVYSTVTGKEREVRTLSGGESFMAALSLALGMADQIQKSAASVHLDMMFIDEGFGSLDEHSRGNAVRILKNMAGGSRMIGIISHVTELKQEIEDQLIVSKDERGSHVRWQIS